jgi:drug/metabolite transporter (DMT)-like permease
MLIIPPQSNRSNRPATQHDTTVGMLVVALIMLAISLFVFIVGPRTGNPPPPPLVGWVPLGLAVLFGFIAFFSWMKEQANGSDGTQGTTPNEEQ